MSSRASTRASPTRSRKYDRSPETERVAEVSRKGIGSPHNAPERTGGTSTGVPWRGAEGPRPPAGAPVREGHGEFLPRAEQGRRLLPERRPAGRRGEGETGIPVPHRVERGFGDEAEPLGHRQERVPCAAAPRRGTLHVPRELPGAPAGG